MRFIEPKIQKTWSVGKIRKIDEEKVSFVSKRKRFHLSKLHLYQIEKAQKMPVVAGRLVLAIQ